jgi:nucleoside-diphosphate-sugar epimerase
METVFVLGCDGYIGHALTLRLLKKGYKVIGIDNKARRRNVSGMGSFSATPISSMEKKTKYLQKLGYNNFSFHLMDVANDYFVDHIQSMVRKYQPKAIVNLAQNPSAPYSQKNQETAQWTLHNNMMGTLNVLYAIAKECPTSHLVQIGTMGEYDPAVNVDIPEGVFDFKFNGRQSNTCIFPRRPGSFYHATKVASTYFIDYACRIWDLKATDIMQGVVYGNWTPEIEETGLHTRLDSDESFGTVINRFIVQGMIEHPLTVFGKGLHKRGFLALNDSIQCLMIAIENPPEDVNYRTWNQLDESFSMNELANKVMKVFKSKGKKISKKYIPSPRKESVDDHYYNPITDMLPSLGFKQTRYIEDEVEYLIDVLTPHKEKIKKLEKVVMPIIKWSNK